MTVLRAGDFTVQRTTSWELRRLVIHAFTRIEYPAQTAAHASHSAVHKPIVNEFTIKESHATSALTRV